MYALTMLAAHPQVQQKVFEEVRDICGDHLPTFADTQNMAYSLCVMYETMRHFPIIGALPHVVASGKDETLLGKYPVPKTALIQMDLQNLHRNEKYWGPDVDDFNPSRFMLETFDKERGHFVDGKIKVPVKGAFVGFSEGPRSCLGDCFGIRCL
jgi:cytochrome P450